MNIVRWAAIASLMGALGLFAACGGGGSSSFSDSGDGGGDGGGGVESQVAALALLASSPTLGTASDSEITLTTIVKDENNRLLAGETIVFTASSGSLAVTSDTTNESGVATAVLSPGSDASNRTITVQAFAGDVSDVFSIQASGTNIAIEGPATVTIGDTATLTLTLTDSAGNGVPFQNVAVEAAGNQLTPVSGSFQTDADGQLVMELGAQMSGTVTASALGASTEYSIGVLRDNFSIATASDDIAIGTCENIAVIWNDANGSPVPDGSEVTVSSTRGIMFVDAACSTEGRVVTTANGVAETWVFSDNPGATKIVAEGTDGPTTSKDAEFIATVPSTFDVKAYPDNIGPGESSTLTVTVRDPNNNLVKNARVYFTIAQDVTGGTLSPGIATTDSFGKASAVYKASSTTSSKDGVVVRVNVVGIANNKTTSLTVAQSELYVKFGLANSIEEETAGSYAQPGTLFVTDANGNSVADATINLSVIPTVYRTGVRRWDDVGEVWAPIKTDECPNEDTLTGDPLKDLNGVLDAGEDFNGSGFLEPGNVAAVEPSLTTDENGMAEFRVRYAKDYAQWVDVTLEAVAKVSGTESSHALGFTLKVAVADVTPRTVSPPGDPSPFGAASDQCPP